LLGQAAPAIPPRPAPPTVRAWLASLGPTVASADWPLVSDVFRPAHPHDAGQAAAVWRDFKEFAKVAGYGTRPATERDFASFVCSVGDSAAWLRCMLRCNPGRVLLVPHPAAELPFVAGEEEYAYLKDWRTRLRPRPAVPFGHSLALANFGGVGPLIALASVHDLLPYHHDTTRQAPCTLLPHQVGTVADSRCHYVRVLSVLRSPQAPLGVTLAEPGLRAPPRGLCP